MENFNKNKINGNIYRKRNGSIWNLSLIKRKRNNLKLANKLNPTLEKYNERKRIVFDADIKTLKTQMIEDKQLSKNFSLYEFLHSQAASRFKVTEQFEPPQEVVNNLTNLCREAIQP